MSPRRRPQETEVEPDVGSVVMVHGIEGTMWQRLKSDGLWHSVTGEVCDWKQVLAIGGQRLPIVILQVKQKRTGDSAI